MPASADTGPDGFTILYADSGNMVHNCEILGSDTDPGYVTDGSDVYQAVVCVDIQTGAESDGYFATGQVEAYCQTNGGVAVPCTEVYIDGVFANADANSPDSEEEATFHCEDGHCVGSRNLDPIWTKTYVGGADCTSSSGHDVWDEALGATYIGIPGGDIFSVQLFGANDGASYSSGHFWVCP